MSSIIIRLNYSKLAALKKQEWLETTSQSHANNTWNRLDHIRRKRERWTILNPARWDYESFWNLIRIESYKHDFTSWNKKRYGQH